MKVFFSSLGVGVISILCTYIYFYHYIDTVAGEIGVLIQKIIHNPDYQTLTTGSYTIAGFIVPLIWGVTFGVVTAGLLGTNFIEGIKERWWLLVLGGGSSLIPTLYCVIGMTFFMEGS